MHLCLRMIEHTRQEPLNAEHLAMTQRRTLIAQSGLSATENISPPSFAVFSKQGGLSFPTELSVMIQYCKQVHFEIFNKLIWA